MISLPCCATLQKAPLTTYGKCHTKNLMLFTNCASYACRMPSCYLKLGNITPVSFCQVLKTKSVLNRIIVQAVLSCKILPITELSRACLGYIFHLLPSVLRAAPASMGMTSRGKIPLSPTATEPTRDRNQT